MGCEHPTLEFGFVSYSIWEGSQTGLFDMRTIRLKIWACICQVGQLDGHATFEGNMGLSPNHNPESCISVCILSGVFFLDRYS